MSGGTAVFKWTGEEFRLLARGAAGSNASAAQGQPTPAVDASANSP